jgi:excisionase family DNA binding protein
MIHRETRCVKSKGGLMVDKSESSGRLTVTVEEAAAILGISRGSAYSAAANGELPVLRVGRRLLVPKLALERLLERAGAREG